ncbi:MAG: hypothetical protein NC115_07205 [Bacteroidales bacterium]|nr:hypothetical protein [Bacteroidales bacterium]
MIKGIFRKRCLEKETSSLPTGFMPAGSIKYMAVLIDADEPGFEKCRESIVEYCRANGIDLNLMYVDMRRSSRKDSPTDKDATFLRSDVNWFGKPSAKKAALVRNYPCDLYICLSRNDGFCIEYISWVAEARFKIGRDRFRKDPFNIIIGENGQESSQDDVFKAIIDLLSKIA